jgi:hypothetical protein
MRWSQWHLMGLLLLAISHSAVAQVNDAVVCKAAKLIAQKANTEAPQWVDHATRFDGMGVVCFARMIEFKKWTSYTSQHLKPGWLEEQQRVWNQLHCAGAFKDAIAEGWQVLNVLTTADGKKYIIKADCAVPAEEKEPGKGV